jgi:hypothetical protein
MIRFALSAVLVTALSLISIEVQAFPGLDATVAARYPAATELATCGTCHTSFSGNPATLNDYGEAVDVARAGGFDFDSAMADVEGDDSDGDGTSNMDEIDTDAGVHPGWTCETYTNALNAPGNLADIVDPIDPGCNGVTTTTQIETTTTTLGTTTTSTTSTTLPGTPQCGQPVTSGPTPVATDCLYILQAAVGSQTCTPECVCAPTGTLPAKATDALLCLNVSVGVALPLNCPCPGGTTTTTLGGGSTTTTLGATTTTLGGGSTTTTLGATTTTTTSTTLEPPTTTTTSTTTTTLL